MSYLLLNLNSFHEFKVQEFFLFSFPSVGWGVFVLWNSMTSLPIWLPSSVIQFKLRNIQKAVLLNSGSLGASLFRRPWSAWSSPCHPALGCDPVPPPGMTFIANILKLKFSMDTQLEFSLTDTIFETGSSPYRVPTVSFVWDQCKKYDLVLCT